LHSDLQKPTNTVEYKHSTQNTGKIGGMHPSKVLYLDGIGGNYGDFRWQDRQGEGKGGLPLESTHHLCQENVVVM
jgi:hypothetical protein